MHKLKFGKTKKRSCEFSEKIGHAVPKIKKNWSIRKFEHKNIANNH